MKIYASYGVMNFVVRNYLVAREGDLRENHEVVSIHTESMALNKFHFGNYLKLPLLLSLF